MICCIKRSASRRGCKNNGCNRGKVLFIVYTDNSSLRDGISLTKTRKCTPTNVIFFWRQFLISISKRLFLPRTSCIKVFPAFCTANSVLQKGHFKILSLAKLRQHNSSFFFVNTVNATKKFEKKVNPFMSAIPTVSLGE